MKILLSVTSLSKAYQNNKIMNDYNLILEPGNVLGIMGSSGCGKSTLLRLVAGLERPDAGEIKLNDIVLSTPERVVAPQKRQMGMVFQHLALWPHLTVRQHLEYGLPKLSKPERISLVKSMLSELKLEQLGNRYPAQLSGGEKQRVSLGRALILKPLIILCDEPFSSLDQELKGEIRDFFYQTIRKENMSAIFVSHDPADLQEADRVERMVKLT